MYGVIATTCCCGADPDSCTTCIQTVWGDTIDTICCKSPDDAVVLKILRPGRVVRQCYNISPFPAGPGCPCCGSAEAAFTYPAQDPHIVVYRDGVCDWLWLFDVAVGPACDVCDSCSGDSFACGSAGSPFGNAMPVDCPSCNYTRWTEYQSTNAAASTTLRWWNDIQCYRAGTPIPATEYAYAPTTAGMPCPARGSNPGGTYYLYDYYLGTFHRRITWQRDCASDTFGTGAESLECMTPESVLWVAAGAPLFEMDLYSAADAALWGRNALDISLVESFICAVRNGNSPSQAEIEAVFAHPANLLATRDWRAKQTADDAYLATIYPTEYGPCSPQTATVGVVVKRCWPAIQPDHVVAAISSLQADCLPTPTAPMEADPAWIIRRPTYFRPRPGYWGWNCTEPLCGDGIWADDCVRFDGAPFGTPSCVSTQPAGCDAGFPTCDYCDPLAPGCPPNIANTTCAGNECKHRMVGASCDGIMWVYAEIQFKECDTKWTCGADIGEDCETESNCVGYYLRESYMNRAYLFTVDSKCIDEGGDPFECIPQDPPVSVAQMWPSLLAQVVLDENSAQIAVMGDGGVCAGIQCEECTACDGLTVRLITGADADELPCGSQAILPEDACIQCWEADACDGECQDVPAVTDCIEAKTPCA